jgi:heme exporter protein CcmD
MGLGLQVLFTAEFWAMGEHGFFVWTSYGFCALAFGLLAGLSIMATKRHERELTALDPSRGRGSVRARARATPPEKG